MTTLLPPQENSPAPPEPQDSAPSTGRLIGIDLARALAVFGMYIAHLGPSSSDPDSITSWIGYLASGRSSILFATLAGFSLMLIAGGRQPKTGLAGRQAKARIAIRAVILVALGTAMAMAYGGVVILAFYGVYFLLALPLVRLSAKTLAITAAALAVITPQLAYLLKRVLAEPVQNSINAFDPLEKLSGVGVLDLLLTGTYPTITWMSFVLAGMALARLDLTVRAVQFRLAVLGAALTVVGYGTSKLLATLGVLNSSSNMPEFAGTGSFPTDKLLSSGTGSFPTDKLLSSGTKSFPFQMPAEWLLTAGPHSGTTFEILGSSGVALLVIVGATSALGRFAWLRRLSKPIIAVGTMSLTAYVGHFLGMSVVAALTGLPALGSGEYETQQSWVPLLMFILGATLFAAVWSRFFRRGPLEYLLNAATKPAKYIR